MNFDPTDRLYSNELAAERGYDLNRETAAECDGISPANVPVWSALRVENMDGTTNINATINAICTHVRTLEEEHADEIREVMHDREIITTVRDEFHNDLIALRNYTQLLELQYADALGELTTMTALRDGLINIMSRAYGNRWSNPGEHGVQRLHADTMPQNRAA